MKLWNRIKNMAHDLKATAYGSFVVNDSSALARALEAGNFSAQLGGEPISFDTRNKNSILYGY